MILPKQLGISHKRVHQIVGVAMEKPLRRKLLGGAASAIVLLAGLSVALIGHWGPGAPAPSVAPPSKRPLPFQVVCSYRFIPDGSGRSISFTALEAATVVDGVEGRFCRGALVAIDPRTGGVLAPWSSSVKRPDRAVSAPPQGGPWGVTSANWKSYRGDVIPLAGG